MKKLLFGSWVLACLAVFSGCTSKDQVNVTRVDEELFGANKVSVDALPFSVTLPDGWTVREEPLLFTLAFDDGASGYIQVAKNPVEAASVGCHEADEKKFCTVEADGALYSVVVDYKTMDASRRAEVEAILASVRAE